LGLGLKAKGRSTNGQAGRDPLNELSLFHGCLLL
jgi:hypothetical protein